MSTKPHRKQHRKQQRINATLKRRLFGHLILSSCHYCRRCFLVLELTIEHLVPLSLGGGNEDSNITLACGPCNHSRGKQTWMDRRRQNKETWNIMKGHPHE